MSTSLTLGAECLQVKIAHCVCHSLLVKHNTIQDIELFKMAGFSSRNCNRDQHIQSMTHHHDHKDRYQNYRSEESQRDQDRHKTEYRDRDREKSSRKDKVGMSFQKSHLID